jgi:protein-tyrosine-phosphatase
MSDRAVVFVCLHGATKSLMAATLFQRLADERGLAVRSTFAGTEPDPAIQPNVVARLLEEGVDVRPLRPRRVTRDELASAWRVVSFGCDLTALAPDARIERWDDVSAVSEDYGRARDVIAARVRMLVGQASGAQ